MQSVSLKYNDTRHGMTSFRVACICFEDLTHESLQLAAMEWSSDVHRVIWKNQPHPPFRDYLLTGIIRTWQLEPSQLVDRRGIFLGPGILFCYCYHYDSLYIMIYTTLYIAF